MASGRLGRGIRQSVCADEAVGRPAIGHWIARSTVRMSSKRFGPFELKERLGAGGMGVVFRAVHLPSGREVALKILPPALSANRKLVARFEREMAILKKLDHPNITRYYGGGKINGQQFYAMQLMHGGTLEDELRRKGRLTWERTIDYGIQICAALDHAHSHGVIHRDLKPANLFLTEQQRIVLGDFGIARDTDATALTAAGYTVGTYAYMAPEQITGKVPVSPKIDLYALGCVLFEMLTGRPPFQGQTQPELLYQHVHKKPPRVAEFAFDCPVWLEDLILQLLAKDPRERPHDAPFVEMKLREVPQKVAEQTSLTQHVAQGGATVVARKTDAEQLKRSLKRRKKNRRSDQPFFEQTWFLASCLAAVLALMAWLLWPASEEELFREAQRLMASDDPLHWQEARDRYLLELLERFPDGKHAQQAREFLDRLAAYQAERRALLNIRLGRAPQSEGERLFVRGYRYEQFGDRLSALEHYRSMVRLLTQSQASAAAASDSAPTGDATSEADRAFVALARQRIREIETAGDLTDRATLLNRALTQGDELWQKGQTLKAREIWNSIITLYGDNREFQVQVERARAALDGQRSSEDFSPNATQPRQRSRSPARSAAAAAAPSAGTVRR